MQRAGNDLKVTRRFIERWAPFSISVNVAVPPQAFAAMESGRSDREPERLVTLCGRPCGDLCSCLEKVDNRPPGTLFALFGGIRDTSGWRMQ